MGFCFFQDVRYEIWDMRNLKEFLDSNLKHSIQQNNS